MTRQKEQRVQVEKQEMRYEIRKGESNDSPEIPDRIAATSDTTGFPSGKRCTKDFPLRKRVLSCTRTPPVSLNIFAARCTLQC